MIAPASEHVLDWFHITMRITVQRQFGQGVENHNEAGHGITETLRRIKWHLWHGNAYRAREEIDELQFDAEALETDYPIMRKFLTAIGEFRSYIASNHASLINYGERYRSGERISSAFVEATVNAVISKRFAKSSKCSGAGSVRIFCYKPGRRPSTAPCARPSSNGIPGWLTTITNQAKRLSPHNCPHFLMLPSLPVIPREIQDILGISAG